MNVDRSHLGKHVSIALFVLFPWKDLLHGGTLGTLASIFCFLSQVLFLPELLK